MRSAKECGNFPYEWKAICYIEIYPNGNVVKVACNKIDIEEAYNKAKKGETQLYAVWLGDYESDLFIIDDLDKLADAYGIDRGDLHIHDIIWGINQYDNPKSRYASVDIEFKCGCEFNYGTLKKLALDLKKQYGWEVATSTGMSSCGNKYTIQVLRKSLTVGED